MIDEACHAGRAEAVVDIYHRDAVRTGVEHAQQRSDPAEARAVAYARWHRDYRNLHQARNDARKCAFHPGDDDEDARVLQAVVLGEESMQARDAHVVHAFDPVTH